MDLLSDKCTLFNDEFASVYSIEKAIMIEKIRKAIYHESFKNNDNIRDTMRWMHISSDCPVPYPSFLGKKHVRCLLRDMVVDDKILTVFKQDEDTVWITFTKEFYKKHNIPFDVYNPPSKTTEKQKCISKHTVHKDVKDIIKNNPTFMCVYILWSGGDLSYIGKTTVGIDRIISSANEHRNTKSITHFSVINMENEEKLDILERMLILDFKPSMNKSFLEVVYKDLIQKKDLVDIYSLDKVRLVEDDFYG